MSFLYISSQHREAFARMRYAIEERKLAFLLLGECGTGKTYMSKALRLVCADENRQFVYFANSRISSDEFLKELYEQIDNSQSTENLDKHTLLKKISQKLKNFYEQTRQLVLIIDEAQSIKDDDLLEEIRMLFNLQQDSANNLTILLLGQPHFKKLLESNPQFRQRLSLAYTLAPLTCEDTKAYVKSRLSTAGGDAEIIIEEKALDVVYNVSKGMPRVINNLCDLSFLNAFLAGKNKVDEESVNKAAGEILSANFEL